MWADAPPDTLAKMLVSSRLIPTPRHDVNYLALSGGGSAGSFAAGLLTGWTKTGKRPEFDIVSGVSVGALIAPFAFVGSQYDPLLEELFKGDATAGLISPENPLKIVGGASLLDSAPLRRMIKRFATPDLLAQIAIEHRRGRRLIIVTTNLDAQRPVLWDIGAIATSGGPNALRLFQDVLLASSSASALYSPVMIDVDIGERHIAEMHVDGGTTAPVFINPEILMSASMRIPTRGVKRIHLWVIINNILAPEFAVTDPAAIAIAVRSLSTIMKSQTKGILTSASETAQRLGMDFNLAYIDQSASYDPSKPFDPIYMNSLFSLGDNEIRTGTPWRKSVSSWMEPAIAEGSLRNGSQHDAN
jgi:predicted acylesterase/phospholipase RssA